MTEIPGIPDHYVPELTVRVFVFWTGPAFNDVIIQPTNDVTEYKLKQKIDWVLAA